MDLEIIDFSFGKIYVMKATTLTFAVILLFLATSCQKNNEFRINDSWSKIDITSDTLGESREIWEMNDGRLTIINRLKDNSFERLTGATYNFQSGINSNYIIIKNCPLETYNGKWSILKLESSCFVISTQSSEGLQYLEFELFQ